MKCGLRLRFFAFVLLLWPWPAVPQEGCENREIPVFVTEKDGNKVSTLTSADFRLESLGTPLNVVGWNRDARRHRVVILLDVSGSMGSFNRRLWPGVIALAHDASYAGGENNDLALALFAGSVLETVGFSQGRDAIRHRLTEIASDPSFPRTGRTNDSRIYDALKEAAPVFGNPTSADSFLVITDGLDEGSQIRPNELLELLSSSMIRVFTILMSPVSQASKMKAGATNMSADAVRFVSFVNKSGGNAFGPIDVDNPAFRRSGGATQKAMYEKLDQFYAGIFDNGVLTVRTASALQNPQAIRVILTDSARQQLKKPKVFFPQEIGSCASIRSSR